jgi:hypothetical protein
MRALTELTGLSVRQATDLVLMGVLERRDMKRRFHVTVESVQRWATGFRPDLLATLGPDASPPHPVEEVRTA